MDRLFRVAALAGQLHRAGERGDRAVVVAAAVLAVGHARQHVRVGDEHIVGRQFRKQQLATPDPIDAVRLLNRVHLFDRSGDQFTCSQVLLLLVLRAGKLQRRLHKQQVHLGVGRSQQRTGFGNERVGGLRLALVDLELCLNHDRAVVVAIRRLAFLQLADRLGGLSHVAQQAQAFGPREITLQRHFVRAKPLRERLELRLCLRRRFGAVGRVSRVSLCEREQSLAESVPAVVADGKQLLLRWLARRGGARRDPFAQHLGRLALGLAKRLHCRLEPPARGFDERGVLRREFGLLTQQLALGQFVNAQLKLQRDCLRVFGVVGEKLPQQRRRLLP